MSKKEALRELQSRLADRLQAARDQASAANWLAVEAGGRGFLLPLAEAGEIFTGRVSCLPVPHTAPWMLGVANLRGHLHSVVDLAAFLGIKSGAPAREANCLVAFNPTLETNCALLVDRLAGLRGREQLQPRTGDDGPRPAFVAGSWTDEQGRVWHELALGALSRHEAFLGVAA
ncbi:MAG: chemotaxis protein CheW [Aquabacterium sp.]|nr:chemotaxis protein CheW [Aquabacterium sp.]